MQRSQAFKATSIQALSDAIDAFFIANAAFVGVSISIAQEGGGYVALVMYTP